MNTPSILDPKDMPSLSASLREAFASASADQAVKWFEQAYRATQFNPNLNELVSRLMPKDAGEDAFHRKAFHSVLANALLHDDSMRDIYLETLWLHLEDGPPERLEQFKIWLKHHASSTFTLNHETQRPTHLALLFLITDGDVKSRKHYMTDLIDQIFIKKDSPEIIKAIEVMGRLNPFSSEVLAVSYSSNHIYKAVPFDTQDPHKMNIIRAIYTTNDSLMRHALRGLKFNISRLLEYYRFLDDGKAIPFTQSDLSGLITLIRLSLTADTLPLLTEALQEAFEEITQPYWRHEQIQASLHAVEPVLSAIIEQVEALDIGLKAIITRAFNTDESGEYNGKTDFMDSAADALLNCHHAPIKRMLATSIIKPLSTEEIVKTFNHRPEVIAEIYKITNNHELIEHMNNWARHASISHDLGL